MVDAIASSSTAWSTTPPSTRQAAGAADGQDPGTPAASPTAPRGANGRPLNASQERLVRALEERDRAVRIHEAAHKAVGGGLTGGASFSYQIGPDGRQYAVGGEVSIDMSSERDPQATISKMQRVVAAALAPADPSGQDRAVAASARAIEQQVQQQQTQQADDRKKPDSTAGRKSGQNQAAKAYGAQAVDSGGQLSVIA